MKNNIFLLIVIFFTFFANGQCIEPSNIHLYTDFGMPEVYMHWDENGENIWDIEYDEMGFTPTGIPTVEDYNSSYYSLNNITNHTYIDFYIRADCGSEVSDWVGPFTFYNYCFESVWGFEINENFNNSFIPACWSESSQGNPNTGIEVIGNSNWVQSDFANDSANSLAAKVTITGTNTNEWLVLPPMKGLQGLKMVEDNLLLNFDIALTQSGSTNTATLGTDDVVQLVISPDYGATWHTIKTWDASSTISNTGEYFNIAYNNFSDGFDLYEKVFLVALWASSGSVDNGVSVDFFVDNMYAFPPFTGAIGDLASKGFSYYPNPTENTLHISAEEIINEIIFYNPLGEKLKRTKIDKFHSQIELTNLPKGIYFMQVLIGNTKGVVPILKN